METIAYIEFGCIVAIIIFICVVIRKDSKDDMRKDRL